MIGIASRQVDYLAVHDLLAPLLGDPGLIPGTPSWCQLDDADPAKWQAILWSSVWWCLEQDSRQAAMADASRSVAASTDWSRIGKPRPLAYVPRRVVA